MRLQLKIVIPVLGFGRAGGERVLSQVATQLVDHGNEVTFVVPQGQADKPYYPTKAGIALSQKSTSNNKYVRLAMTYFYLWRECKKQKPDIVLANFHMMAYLVALLPISNKKKLYYIQAYEVMFGKNSLRKLFAYLTYLLPLRKIVNHKDILPAKINNYEAVIPAGLDLNLFKPQEINNSFKIQTIGFIGRQEKHKGSDELIDVLCAHPYRHDITLNIAIYLSDENRAKLETAGINYCFYTISSDEELATFYRRNHLMLAVGLIEDGAFHYPCAESMASGCLVISNYAPLTETESHFTLTTFDPNLLTEKIKSAFELDSTSYNSEIQRNITAVAKYDWKTIGQQFNSLIQKH